MAFSTSNLVLRCGGSTRILTGNWSANAGDTPGTIAIGSGNIVNAEFDPRLATGPAEYPSISTSVSGNQTTVTVYHHQTVTNGTFSIEY